MERRRLGDSDLDVSVLSLGSWRTYERISPDAGVAVMNRAREAGINFLDDARYDDESGHAPMKTGYSEVVFGRLFRTAGWKRDEVVLANKLWWEFWPRQSAAEEVDASLQRMGMDHIDLAYAAQPAKGMDLTQMIDEIAALIAAGKIRAWGVLNWPARLIAEAAGACAARGVPGPCAAQLAYSLVRRSPVEDAEMVAALDRSHVAVVASYTLHGGALSGKYSKPGAQGRITARLDGRDYSQALAAAQDLGTFGQRIGAAPAPLAIAFALANPRVASVVFGATDPRQIDDNLQALDLRSTLSADAMTALRRIGAQA